MEITYLEFHAQFHVRNFLFYSQKEMKVIFIYISMEFGNFFLKEQKIFILQIYNFIIFFSENITQLLNYYKPINFIQYTNFHLIKSFVHLSKFPNKYSFDSN